MQWKVPGNYITAIGIPHRSSGGRRQNTLLYPMISSPLRCSLVYTKFRVFPSSKVLEHSKQDTRYKMILLSFHVYNYTHIRHV